MSRKTSGSQEVNTAGTSPVVTSIDDSKLSSLVQFTLEQQLSLRELQVQALVSGQEAQAAAQRAQNAAIAFNQALQKYIKDLDVRDADLDLSTLKFRARPTPPKA